MRRENRLGKTLRASAVLLCGAAAAQAQSGEDFPLDPIILRNQEDATGPVGGDKNPPTVTGSKVPLRISEIPQSVTVLGRDDIERFDSARIGAALRYAPGVSAETFGDDQDYDWIRIRGFQADQTGVYLDNAQNLAFAFGSFYIDPYTLERIEILRGPSSALYGGSNPGGIVNYVSKRPGGRLREFIASVNDAPAGSLAFDFGDDLGNDRSYRVTGRIAGGDLYDDFNNGVRGTLAPSFRFVTDAGTEITFLANLHSADEQHNGNSFLPYFGTVKPTVEFGFIDPDANFSDPDWDSYVRNQALVSAIVEHGFDNGFTFTGLARLGVAEIDERYWFPNGYTGGSLRPVDAVGTLDLIGFEHDTTLRTAQTDLRYYGTIETGAVSHNLLFGLDARYYWLDETQAVGFGTNRVVNPIPPGVPDLLPPFQDGITTQSQLGLYAQNQLRFGQGWLATFNLRHDFVETEQGGSGEFERSDSETSYRAALAYEFNNEFTPYASYATFFNPLIASPANGVTEPETGDQFEVGFKWSPVGSNFFLSGAAFQIDRKNVVTGVFPFLEQLGEVRMRGIEFEGRVRLIDRLEIGAAATFLDAEITEESDPTLVGKTPALVPDAELSLFAEYEFDYALDGLTVGAGVRYRGESFADDENEFKVGSYTLVDLFASYEIRDGIFGQLTVTNVGDTRYVTGCQTALACSYGSGREISLALVADF